VIAGFQIVLFGNRIDLCLVSTISIVTRTFRKIGPPLFSSSGTKASGIPLGSHLSLVSSVLVFVP